MRCYLRGRIAFEAGNPELAHAITENGVDFWQSHIIGVLSGNSPKVATEFIRNQVNPETKLENVTKAWKEEEVSAIRLIAKAVNRTNSNVLTLEYDTTDAAEYVFRWWEQYLDETQ